MKPLLALASMLALVMGGLLVAAKKGDAVAPSFSDDFSSVEPQRQMEHAQG